MDPLHSARARLARLHDRLPGPSRTDEDRAGAFEDEIFETLDGLEGAQKGSPGEAAILLLQAIAPICHHRPDLSGELLRYPARHLDAMGFTTVDGALRWIEEAPLASDEVGSLWLLTELPRAVPLLQEHLDQLRAGRESWAEPAATPDRLVQAWHLVEQGRRREAMALYDELAAEADEPMFYRFEAARLGVLEGEPERADALLRDRDLFPVFRARLLALSGDHEGAVEEIRAILQETPDFALDEEEDFDVLRPHPGFDALLRRGGPP